VQGLVIWGSPGPLTPASLTGPEVAIALAAGSAHNLAADAAGHVWAWGANGFGQLGDGTTTARTNPIQVPELEGVIAVAAGDDHSLALLADGSVRAWGANAAGQLGDGTSQDQARPVVVQGLEHVRSLAAGHAFSLALQTDGTVWAWGANEAGQLGDGSNTPSGLPVRVRGLEGVEMIAAGAYFGLARKADGSVWAWGADEYGQLGQGTPSPGRNAPVPVARLSRITTIAAGSYHALAVDASGTVWAWGANWFDELGGSFDETCVHAGQQHPCSSVARPVGGLERPIARVAAGEFHSLGLASDGTVWAWGRNADGELGDGTRESSRVPVQVRGLAGEAAIAAGGRHSLAARPPQAAPSSEPSVASELASR
jgi:alpha-tubulin suppressor-like RCC1 family protein